MHVSNHVNEMDARVRASSNGASSRSTDFAGENIDLRNVLVSGRGQSVADRTKMWLDYSRGAVAHRRRLYGREIHSPADRTVAVWNERTGRTRQMIMFGSNNYLGLATHPHVLDSVRSAITSWGVGLSGPPLLNGTTRLHRSLEERLASFKGKESTILFSSGYGTNLGLISGLVQHTDRVLYDAESHASLLDGLKLGGIRGHRFRHNDVDQLACLLDKKHASTSGDTFVGVEGVYSMRGDLAPLDRIVPLCRRHDAIVMIDDAHGTGVTGPQGRGTAARFELEDQIDIVMGTFSKVFGMTGGFIAASAPIIEYLRFFARPYIFSAALSPVVAAAVLAGLDVLEREPERLKRLHDNVQYVARGLRALGIHSTPEAGIIAIPAPRGMDFSAAASYFDRVGLFVNAIEYPAVRRDQELFRISLMATHTKDDLDHLLNGVAEAWQLFTSESET